MTKKRTLGAIMTSRKAPAVPIVPAPAPAVDAVPRGRGGRRKTYLEPRRNFTLRVSDAQWRALSQLSIDQDGMSVNEMALEALSQWYLQRKGLPRLPDLPEEPGE